MSQPQSKELKDASASNEQNKRSAAKANNKTDKQQTKTNKDGKQTNKRTRANTEHTQQTNKGPAKTHTKVFNTLR